MPVLASGPDLLGKLEQTHLVVLSDAAGLLRGLLLDVNVFQVIGVLMFPLVGFVLWRTAFGLRLRSAGENPWAAESLGVNVMRAKYVAVLASGALAGLGGLFLVLFSGLYKEGQTGGRGYIGLAAMIFGNWRPGGLASGALLFGYTDAVRLRSTDSTAVLALFLFAAIAVGALGIWWLRQGRRMAGVGVHRPRRRVPAGLPRPGLAAQRGHHRDAVHRDAGRPGRLVAEPAAAEGRRHPLSTRRGAVRSMERPAAAVDWDLLRRKAIEAMECAYAPYSEFPVGVAGLVDDGRVVTGCNVENAAYGVALCAECGMVSQLHLTGGGRLVAVSCVNADGDPLMACGRCRQLLWENGGPDCQVMTPLGVRADERDPAPGLRRGRPGQRHLTVGAGWQRRRSPGGAPAPQRTGVARRTGCGMICV